MTHPHDATPPAASRSRTDPEQQKPGPKLQDELAEVGNLVRQMAELRRDQRK